MLVPTPAPAGVLTRSGHNRSPARTSSQCLCPQAEVPALITKIVVPRPVIMPAKTPQFLQLPIASLRLPRPSQGSMMHATHDWQPKSAPQLRREHGSGANTYRSEHDIQKATDAGSARHFGGSTIPNFGDSQTPRNGGISRPLPHCLDNNELCTVNYSL